ncbi:MAG: RDD family protein [Candidatus Hydrothermarchaeota archaeon]
MAKEEDDIFKTLSHPIRRSIIELLHENTELSYTEMLSTLKIDTGQLNFHLRKMRGLCKTTGQGTYILTDKGKIAYNVIKEIKKISDEQVIIEPQTSILNRFAATIIDFMILVVLPVSLIVLVGMWVPILKHGINIIEIIIYAQGLVAFDLIVLVLMETYNGQTIGKYLIGIKVLKENGRKLNLVESSLRNIGKVFLLPLDLLAGLLIFRGKKYLRFSDYYVRAKVVDLDSMKFLGK